MHKYSNLKKIEIARNINERKASKRMIAQHDSLEFQNLGNKSPFEDK